MEIHNATRFRTTISLRRDPDGREHAVAIIKGTFDLPADGENVLPAAKQVAFVEADEFTGDPGFSATKYESDYAPFKPKCDVLLNGSAYGNGADRVTVGLRIGPMKKVFDVIGHRTWQKGVPSFSPSLPRCFKAQEISYDHAYGGVDTDPDDPEKMDAHLPNPVGSGFYRFTKGEALIDQPLPSQVPVGGDITATHGKFPSLSFGAIGRNFAERIPLAGTYGDDWMENRAPDLPDDFDPAYHQSAPADQQIDYPKGGEVVELMNLTPEGRLRFELPKIKLPVEFTNIKDERTLREAVLDTILIEPDEGRLILTWRTSAPLKRSMLELRQLVIGTMPRGFYRAREGGKAYYPSLSKLVRSGREE